MKPVTELAVLALHHAVIANQLGVTFKHFWKQFFLKETPVVAQFNKEELDLLLKLALYSEKHLTKDQIKEFASDLSVLTKHYAKQRAEA